MPPSLVTKKLFVGALQIFQEWTKRLSAPAVMPLNYSNSSDPNKFILRVVCLYPPLKIAAIFRSGLKHEPPLEIPYLQKRTVTQSPQE